nr:MAG TPA: hypothetical protein [Caudoviricetes sp.]
MRHTGWAKVGKGDLSFVMGFGPGLGVGFG